MKTHVSAMPTVSFPVDAGLPDQLVKDDAEAQLSRIENDKKSLKTFDTEVSSGIDNTSVYSMVL